MRPPQEPPDRLGGHVYPAIPRNLPTVSADTYILRVRCPEGLWYSQAPVQGRDNQMPSKQLTKINEMSYEEQKVGLMFPKLNGIGAEIRIFPVDTHTTWG